MNKFDVTGIVLSGGKSSRLGEEKGLALFNGKPLVTYAISILKPLCGKLIISANHHQQEYAKYGFEVVEDQIKDIGPMGGLYTCLKHSTTRYNMVLSCDTPFINTRLFEYLLDNIENFQAVVPVHDDGLVEPLCAVYATNTIWSLQMSIEKGNYKLMDFLNEINHKKMKIDQRLPFYSDELFVNINTKTDLKNHSAGGE